jgi:hypothetical protein
MAGIYRWKMPDKIYLVLSEVEGRTIRLQRQTTACYFSTPFSL